MRLVILVRAPSGGLPARNHPGFPSAASGDRAKGSPTQHPAASAACGAERPARGSPDCSGWQSTARLAAGQPVAVTSDEAVGGPSGGQDRSGGKDAADYAPAEVPGSGRAAQQPRERGRAGIDLAGVGPLHRGGAVRLGQA